MRPQKERNMADIAIIENRIVTLRQKQGMLDRDLAELYGLETKRLNEQVKRNIDRFPEDFMFQLNEDEFNFLRSQNATSKKEAVLRSQFVTSKTETRGGRQYLPYAFTEQGVAMLSSVLKSKTAIDVNIKIMRAFVAMRHFVASNAEVFAELNAISDRQLSTDLHLKETDRQIEQLFALMDKYKIEDKQGIFFQGQIFDAYAKFEKVYLPQREFNA